MSWRATAWAKDHLKVANSSYEKLLLMVLANYFDDETNTAWPKQETLAADMGVTTRTVRSATKALESVGLIEMERGSFRRRPMYKFSGMPSSFAEAAADGVSGIHSSIPEESLPESPSGNATTGSTASSLPEKKRHEYKEEEPSVEPSVTPEEGEIAEVFQILRGLTPWEMGKEGKVAEWLKADGVGVESAMSAALDLASKWPGPKNNPYKNPMLAFRKWARSQQAWSRQRTNGARPASASSVEEWFKDEPQGLGPPR